MIRALSGTNIRHRLRSRQGQITLTHNTYAMCVVTWCRQKSTGKETTTPPMLSTLTSHGRRQYTDTLKGLRTGPCRFGMKCSFIMAADGISFQNKERAAGSIPKGRGFVFSMRHGCIFIAHVYVNLTEIAPAISQRIASYAITGGGYADNRPGVRACHGHPNISMPAWKNGIMHVV